MIKDIGLLNSLCKEKKYFWGIKKNGWEDFYHIEVSSHNFDSRHALHEEVQFVDDAILRMKEFIENA